MSHDAGVTLIDPRYVGFDILEQEPVTSTTPYVSRIGRSKPTPVFNVPARNSAASSLHAYVVVSTGTSDAINTVEGADVEREVRARRSKNAAAIALLDSWLADDSDYDENTWPALKERIEEARTSSRRRFRD